MGRVARKLNGPGPRALVDEDGFLKTRVNRVAFEAPNAIYYLISKRDRLALHRRTAECAYHFFAGDAVELTQLSPAGDLITAILDLARPRALVTADVWQGLRLKDGGQWALLGLGFASGYDPRAIEFGRRADLVRQFADHRAVIRRFTRSR